MKGGSIFTDMYQWYLTMRKLCLTKDVALLLLGSVVYVTYIGNKMKHFSSNELTWMEATVWNRSPNGWLGDLQVASDCKQDKQDTGNFFPWMFSWILLFLWEKERKENSVDFYWHPPVRLVLYPSQGGPSSQQMLQRLAPPWCMCLVQMLSLSLAVRTGSC